MLQKEFNGQHSIKLIELKKDWFPSPYKHLLTVGYKKA